MNDFTKFSVPMGPAKARSQMRLVPPPASSPADARSQPSRQHSSPKFDLSPEETQRALNLALRLVAMDLRKKRARSTPSERDETKTP